MAEFDHEELVRWMVERVDGLAELDASMVMLLWDEHLAAIGAVPADAVEGRWYAPGSERDPSGEPGIADPARVARDAPALIGVDRDLAAAALAVEEDYLRHLGVID